jgi:uncharacterized protein YjbJ (UPF0337 family)
MEIKAIVSRIKRVVYIGFAAFLICSSLVLSAPPPALAGREAANVVQDRAEQELDRVAGSGTANQIKGRAEEDLGRVQRQIDQTASQVEGATKQVKGRAQRDIGRTQEAAEDATDAIEDSSQGLMRSVRDLFD